MTKPLITKDTANNKLIVERSFAAPGARVWDAWTKSELLDQWWAPKPWKAVTKSHEFREGGHWLYCMQGPDGEQQWCVIDYLTIDPQNGFTAQDSFSDENGVKTSELPSTHWHNAFTDEGEGTKVTCTLSFASAADMEKLVAMGFEEGFSMGLGNLEEMLAA